jgi:hypothetical protein
MICTVYMYKMTLVVACVITKFTHEMWMRNPITRSEEKVMCNKVHSLNMFVFGRWNVNL